MKPIRTPRLLLRNWEERDRDLFHRINSDPMVMEFFPFRRDRAQADAKMNELQAAIDSDGFGFAAMEVAETGLCAGFAGLSRPSDLPMFPASTIEIGWRLAPEFWGKGYATEAAEAWLTFGFGTLGLDEIVSFAVAANRRSTAIMERIGMKADPASDFDHPAIGEDHAHLSHHVTYRLSRADWQARRP
ncbi:MAG: GNAT family N-acetyltransferase [Hyphomicrobiales bacterium]|nr:GNAT family N-acetyltransferase [Hyphomicrobiales bacterium]